MHVLEHTDKNAVLTPAMERPEAWNQAFSALPDIDASRKGLFKLYLSRFTSALGVTWRTAIICPQ